MIKPNFQHRGQLSNGALLKEVSAKQYINLSEETRHDQTTIKPNQSIPEGLIKARSTPKMFKPDQINAIIVKNIASHAIGTGYYSDQINGKAVLQRAGTFVISEVADGMNLPPEKLINSTPIPASAKSMVVKTMYNLIVNSLIEMRAPTVKDIVIYGLPEVVEPLIKQSSTFLPK